MAHDHGASRVTIDRLFEGSERVHVEIVRRLVKQQQVSSLKDTKEGKGGNEEEREREKHPSTVESEGCAS